MTGHQAVRPSQWLRDHPWTTGTGLRLPPVVQTTGIVIVHRRVPVASGRATCAFAEHRWYGPLINPEFDQVRRPHWLAHLSTRRWCPGSEVFAILFASGESAQTKALDRSEDVVGLSKKQGGHCVGGRYLSMHAYGLCEPGHRRLPALSIQCRCDTLGGGDHAGLGRR